MAPHQQGSGFMDFIYAAGQNSFEILFGDQFQGDTDNIHGRQRLAAHGIDITQGIGRRYLTEQIGIIHNRRKKIHRLNQGDLRRQAVNSGVIRGFHADQKIRVLPAGQTGQDFLQVTGRNFGCSTGGSHLVH